MLSHYQLSDYGFAEFEGEPVEEPVLALLKLAFSKFVPT